jgi:hypothetical protein
VKHLKKTDMKHLEEIVRELCWNSDIDQAYDYLVNDRSLEIPYEDIKDIRYVIGNFIDLAYYPNPYHDKSINMNDFVDGLEEMVWDNYKEELNEL